MEFKDKLILLRVKLGFSQSKMANSLGVSQPHYSKWESGTTMPSRINEERVNLLFEKSKIGGIK